MQAVTDGVKILAVGRLAAELKDGWIRCAGVLFPPGSATIVDVNDDVKPGYNWNGTAATEPAAMLAARLASAKNFRTHEVSSELLSRIEALLPGFRVDALAALIQSAPPPTGVLLVAANTMKAARDGIQAIYVATTIEQVQAVVVAWP